MVLKEVTLYFNESMRLPPEVAEFVTDMNQRIDHFLEGKPFAEKGFVACDHELIARALISIRDQQLLSGNEMCEWGSGFGGVASVASFLGFEACGIEINTEVLQHSIDLANEYDLDVDFVEGSFLPEGSDDLVDQAYRENDGDITLETHFDDAYRDLAKDISDFDLIFVFPWPNDAPLLSRIFDRYASFGSILLTYNDFSGLKVERKIG